MTEIDSITLENEMDVVIAQQRMMRAGKLLCLTLSTQTTISTAIAEISRAVIDKTDTGILTIGIERKDGKYYFTGIINYSELANLSSTDETLRYARLLVPEFRLEKNKSVHTITVQIGIPRTGRVGEELIHAAVNAFKEVKPSSPYEKLKFRNNLLQEQTLEQELELKHTRLLNEKKSEFISIASHELKTPLTTLIAFAQLGLSETQKQPGNTTLYLEKIHTQANKLHALIQQLLNIAKIEAGKMEMQKQNVEWNAYVETLLPTFKLLVAQHRFIAASTVAEQYIMLDTLRIEQVLTNIIVNAAKYSEQGTPITLSYRVEGPTLVVGISDEGIGVSEEHLQQIFEKYFREPHKSGQYTGLGMGLYISASIVEAHGGRIWVENNERAGSTFYFTLPVGEAQVAEAVW